MNFGSGGNQKAKAWRDIWGSGQGVGAIDAVLSAGELVAKFAEQYEDAKAELAAKTVLTSGARLAFRGRVDGDGGGDRRASVLRDSRRGDTGGVETLQEFPCPTTSRPACRCPSWPPARPRTHITVNEALGKLDGLVQLAVQSRSVAAQPASPGDGAMHILPSGATGASWLDMAGGLLARYADGVSETLTPRAGWLAWIIDEGLALIHDGEDWTPLSSTFKALTASALAVPRRHAVRDPRAGADPVGRLDRHHCGDPQPGHRAGRLDPH